MHNIPYPKINFIGFHIFVGLQSFKVGAIIETHQKTFEITQQLLDLVPINIDYINFGDGLGKPYFLGE